MYDLLLKLKNSFIKKKKMHCGDCFFKEVFDENKGNKIIKLSTTM